ncbi:MAG: 4-phosphoerythronate dehydrogenase [Bacteroidaceae bacterium]|nr:4-phosphoerythronate dehydrogenase [Bacteroidaceae bacterium]
MKIIIDDKIPYIRGEVERLADEVVYLPGNKISAEDVREADALVVRTRTLCNRQLLEGSRVGFIVTATIGYDHLDTAYLREAGIPWTNCPGCNATSVAQYVRNSLLEAERDGIVRLSEATLGIVGYGHVGKAVYAALRPYVKEILVNDPPLEVESLKLKVECYASGEGDNRRSVAKQLSTFNFQLSTLEALQASCDIITLHTPLTTDGPYPTWHLVDEPRLRAMRKRPVIVNAARGGVVDEEALEWALDKGLVRQAIIDTWEDEPHVRRSLLQKVFIGTPHIAGYSADGKANATRMALEALARWKGERLMGKGEGITFDIRPAEAGPERTGLRYSPKSDSEALKRAPEAFERQRGNYPLRRE